MRGDAYEEKSSILQFVCPSQITWMLSSRTVKLQYVFSCVRH